MRIADRAAPASTMLSGLAAVDPVEDRAKTAAVTSAQPISAGHTYPVGESVQPNTRESTTAAAAPALIPRIPGSVSGLRVCPWMTVPAAPRAAPTSRASTVRGSRSSPMTTTSSSPLREAGSRCGSPA